LATAIAPLRPPSLQDWGGGEAGRSADAGCGGVVPNLSKNVLNARKAVLLRLPFQGGRATGGGQPCGLAAASKKPL